MRFKASIQNITTFTKFTASLASLGPIAWVRFSEHDVRFTIIPEQGTQVWAVLAIDTIFDAYSIQSAAGNVINLEVPLTSLHRALKSALQATAASIRLTKKDNIPLLALTIVTSTLNHGGNGTGFGVATPRDHNNHSQEGSTFEFALGGGGRERETTVTQEIPVRVLSPANVEGIHEPRCREPDVHILLPPLLQLKSISDRFTKLAMTAKAAAGTGTTTGVAAPKLEMAANMHGCLRLSIRTDAMRIASLWTGLTNPELDPDVVGGADAVANHPTTRMKELGAADGRSEEGWAQVRIDGRDWSKVMSVGRMGGKVIACFCHEHALILYVYLPNDDEGREDSVLTYYVSSYSA